MSEEKIRQAIDKVKLAFPEHVVGACNNYIVIANNRPDFDSKCRRISRGDTDGFYTIHRILNNF